MEHASYNDIRESARSFMATAQPAPDGHGPDATLCECIAPYGYILRTVQRKWATSELDEFLHSVMKESAESAHRGFELIDFVAAEALLSLMKANAHAIELKASHRAPAAARNWHDGYVP
ncbi:MAG: hypothetical protein CVU30_05720 [Betaproteobacteria bacterium HGW-Betaproteobacteria-3]|jgi:hypothetical protein|nr:MAG: hypothetical protein CVU30_05720 [Betaproteobacteria bacterium HGW-Betaproteobacteria-3]